MFHGSFLYIQFFLFFNGEDVSGRGVWKPLVLVPLHVQCQVVGAREAAPAGNAFEGLGARVFAEVPG